MDIEELHQIKDKIDRNIALNRYQEELRFVRKKEKRQAHSKTTNSKHLLNRHIFYFENFKIHYHFYISNDWYNDDVYWSYWDSSKRYLKE